MNLARVIRIQKGGLQQPSIIHYGFGNGRERMITEFYVNDNPKINDNLGMTQDIYVGSCREFGYALKKKPSFYFQIVHNVNNIMTFQKPILKVDSEGKRFLIHLFRRRVLKIEFTEDDLIFKIVRIKKATKKYRIAYREDPLLKLKKENKFPTTNLEDIPRLPLSRAFLVGVLVSNVGIQALWRNERGKHSVGLMKIIRKYRR